MKNKMQGYKFATILGLQTSHPKGSRVVCVIVFGALLHLTLLDEDKSMKKNPLTKSIKYIPCNRYSQEVLEGLSTLSADDNKLAVITTKHEQYEFLQKIEKHPYRYRFTQYKRQSTHFVGKKNFGVLNWWFVGYNDGQPCFENRQLITKSRVNVGQTQMLVPSQTQTTPVKTTNWAMVCAILAAITLFLSLLVNGNPAFNNACAAATAIFGVIAEVCRK